MDDVSAAVRAVASATKGYAGELPDVYMRARRHRRRRRTAAVLGVFLLVAAAGLGFAVRAAPPTVPPAATVAPTGQRLLLPGVELEPGGAAYRHPEVIGEVTAEGEIATYRLAGASAWKQAVGLPGGGMVALGDRSTLATVDAHRSRTSRDIGRPGETVSLVAATDTTVYLWRPQGLAAYDLRSGLERLVITSPTREDPRDDPAAPPVAADVVGERLILSRPADPCRPMLLDLTSLRGLRDLSLTSLGCDAVTGLRLSPSTGRLAVTYRNEAGPRVAVLNTEDGTILADRRVPSDATAEVAWQDDRNLRGVEVKTGSGAAVLTPFTIPT